MVLGLPALSLVVLLLMPADIPNQAVGGRARSALKSRASWLPLIFSLAVAACASAPEFNLDTVNRTVQPREVSENLEKYKSQRVLWGGVIINSRNVEQGSELEVLAYPLTRNLKPNTEKGTLGRVLAFSDGYLETLDYAAGRVVTLVGTVKGTDERLVGDAKYIYPVVVIAQIHLWPEQDAAEQSQVRFGIGVGVTVH